MGNLVGGAFLLLGCAVFGPRLTLAVEAVEKLESYNAQLPEHQTAQLFPAGWAVLYLCPILIIRLSRAYQTLRNAPAGYQKECGFMLALVAGVGNKEHLLYSLRSTCNISTCAACQAG